MSRTVVASYRSQTTTKLYGGLISEALKNAASTVAGALETSDKFLTIESA
jgi:hypothetical protein